MLHADAVAAEYINTGVFAVGQHLHFAVFVAYDIKHGQVAAYDILFIFHACAFPIDADSSVLFVSPQAELALAVVGGLECGQHMVGLFASLNTAGGKCQFGES